MNPDDLSILTEFSVALAGFSGIALALTKGTGELSGLQRFRTTALLTWTLVPAFASTLPLLFQGFGLPLEQVWAWSSGTFALLLVVSASQPYLMVRGLDEVERGQLSTALWWLAAPSNIALAGVLAVNALRGAVPGPIVLAILWQLAIAATLFIRLLLAPKPEG